MVRKFGHQHLIAQLQSEATKGNLVGLNMVFKKVGKSNLKMIDAESKHLDKASAAHEEAKQRVLLEVTLKEQLAKLLKHMKKTEIVKIKSQLDETNFVRDLVNLHYKFAKALEATKQVSKEKHLLERAIAAKQRARDMIIAKGGSIRTDERIPSCLSARSGMGVTGMTSMALSDDVEAILSRDPTTNPVMQVILQRCESGKLQSGSVEGDAAEFGRGVVAYVSFSGGEDCNVHSGTTQRWIEGSARSLLISPLSCMSDKSILDLTKERTSTDLLVIFQAWEQGCQTMSQEPDEAEPTPKVNYRSLFGSLLEHLEWQSFDLLYGRCVPTVSVSESVIKQSSQVSNVPTGSESESVIKQAYQVSQEKVKDSARGESQRRTVQFVPNDEQAFQSSQEKVRDSAERIVQFGPKEEQAFQASQEKVRDSALTDPGNSIEGQSITPEIARLDDADDYKHADSEKCSIQTGSTVHPARTDWETIGRHKATMLAQGTGILNIIQGFSSQVLYLKMHGASAESFIM